MAALPAHKFAILSKLVETAPDRVVASLRLALADTADDSALGCVRRLVEAEVADRAFRGAVLSPVAPMFVGTGDSSRALTFPSRALPMIWRGLKAVESEAVARALAESQAPDTSRDQNEGLDQLVAAAARGLRGGETDEFRAAAAACDQGRTNGAAALANCLDIAAVVRRAAGKLPLWIAHAGGETSAAARLAFHDAVEISDDAGPRFFEMLAAQLAQPWMVLRIISAVMERPTERYMAETELAGFVIKVMEDIDLAITAIDGLDADGGPGIGQAIARTAEIAVAQIAEIETNFELTNKRGWGNRAHKQRLRLAAVVEGQLRETDTTALNALPMHATRLHGVQRTVPNLEEAPDPLVVNRAMALLSFTEHLRTAANYGGFSTPRLELIEKLRDAFANYVEDVLGLIRSGDVDDLSKAAAYLEVAADFSDRVAGEKAGELIRRRAQVALAPQSSTVAQN